MMIWLVLAAMTGAVALAVLWPLTRPWASAGADADVAFYEAQIADIEREAARGLIGAREIDSARHEAARRLLSRSRVPAEAGIDQGERALRRRRAASALALSMIPLVSLGLYGAFGSPHLPAQPLAARLSVDPAQLSVAEAVARIEAHLAMNPDDGKGWELLAPVYLRVNRPADAARAFAAANRALGETPQRLTDQAEAEILAAGGVVSAESRDILRRSLSLDAAQPKARFYEGMASEQDGDLDAAKATYRALLASAAPDAPWLPVVRERLATLEGGASIASLPQDQQSAAIQSMVEGLAARLAGGEGTAQDWLRLVRSYAVLGDAAKASEALSRARARLAADPQAMSALAALATEFRLADVPAGSGIGLQR